MKKDRPRTNCRGLLWAALQVLSTLLLMGTQAHALPPEVGMGGVELVNMGSGTYSGGYYQDVSETVDEGYWDNSTGYWQTIPGYWDGDFDYTQDPPLWVPYWVPDQYVWISVPTWVPDYEYVTVSVYFTATLQIGSSGAGEGLVSANLGITDPTGVSVGSYTGTYALATAQFAISGVSLVAVNYGGSSPWTPFMPPSYSSFGPPALWVNGSIYSWTNTIFDDETGTIGADRYSNGSGNTASVSSSGDVNVSLALPGGSTTSVAGAYSNGIFGSVGAYGSLAADVRAADSSGNVLYNNPPGGSPPAFRVVGSSSLWTYLGGSDGYGGGVLHYGGAAGERLLLDGTVIRSYSSGDVLADFFPDGNVVWTDGSAARAIRAVQSSGVLWPPDSSMGPLYGPAGVWVEGALWAYAGTWTGTSGANFTPLFGDHYLGDNDGQELVINSVDQVTVYNIGGTVKTGTYSYTSETPENPEPSTFDVEGVSIYAGNSSTPYTKVRPTYGPPAVWVNGINYQFAGSFANADASGWVDVYRDGAGDQIQITPAGAIAFGPGGSELWAATYAAASSDPADGGIFGVTTSFGGALDVRASNGTMTLISAIAPISTHPLVVKVNSAFWRLAGSIHGTVSVDYYFGSDPGEWLWIDDSNQVGFSLSPTDYSQSGSAHLYGSVFIQTSGVTSDIRACASDNSLAAVGTPLWGPQGVWVEGVDWVYMGTVDDDTTQTHADYYGGLNPGQILTIDNQSNFHGLYEGSYVGGVFIPATGNADLRALDGSGFFVLPQSGPGSGRPVDLRIGGLQWRYLGTANGVDYYASEQTGQRLEIDSSGNVTYSDRPDNIAQATGTIDRNGNFIPTGGGIAFNAGTVQGDLDVLGNIISFGSLKDDPNMTGATLNFTDDIVSSPAMTTVSFASARPRAAWSWSHGVANDAGVLTTLTKEMMRLDDSNRLSLPQPTAGGAGVLLDPAGTSVFNNDLSIGGSLTMGGAPVLSQTAGDGRYLMKQVEPGQATALNNGLNVAVGGQQTQNNVADVTSVAMGAGLNATAGQLVFGRYNQTTNANDFVFVVGAGTDDADRKNALSINSEGDTTVGGAFTTASSTTSGNAQVNGQLAVGQGATFSSSVKVVGNASVQGVLRVREQGDISMGIFNHGTQP